MRRVLIALVSLVTVACGDGGAGPGSQSVAVRTERAEYRPGNLVVVTTTNRSGRTIYDDHCGGEVQGYEYLEEWDANFGAARVCWEPVPAVAIPPGTAHVDTLGVNGQAYTGTWRVELRLLDDAGAPLPEAQRVSNTFRVRGTWAPAP
jgi:hypothetical protein